MNTSVPQTPPPLVGAAVPRRLLSLAGPIIASMISHTLMQFVDFAMVSRLGVDAMAAVMPASIIVFSLMAFGMGLLTIVNTLVSQSLGRGRMHDCASYGWQGFYVAMGMGLLVLGVRPFVEEIFALTGHEPQVQAMEAIYLSVSLFSVGPALAGMGLSEFFAGVHRTGITTIAAVAGNVVNLAANWVLIFGHMGVEPMGIEGAAWGTVIGVSTQMMILLLWMLGPRFNSNFATRRYWRFHPQHMGRLIRVGTPAGIQHVADIFAFTIFTLVLIGRENGADGQVRFDQHQQAAHNLAVRYLHLAFLPTIGLSVATAAMVGRSIGEQRPGQARVVVRWATLFGMGYMGVIGLIYLLAGESLAGLMTNEPEVIDWARRLLALSAVFHLFSAMELVYGFALRGAGDVLRPTLYMVGLSSTILVGGGFLMSQWYPQLGSIGPWIAATVYIMLLAPVYYLRWRYGPWSRIDLFAGRVD